MISETSAAQWLADHVGADWLHVALKPNAAAVGTDFLVTLRFNKDYCQSSVHLHFDTNSNAELFKTLVKYLSQMRDEFFLLKMHSIPVEEGLMLETQSRK